MRQSISYIHKQQGTLIIVVISIATFVIILPVGIMTGSLISLGMLVLFGFILFMFASLTVEVRHERLKFWFGPGLISKTYEIEDIATVKSVVNPWYYGWGVRFTPRGWLYNVSGFGAVELNLKSGKRFRIGTDEPDTLAKAIHQALDNQNHVSSSKVVS